MYIQLAECHKCIAVRSISYC